MIIERFKAKVFILALGTIICCTSFAHAYDDIITHPKISEKALMTSGLNDYLINALGMEKGLLTILTNAAYKSDSILEWIKKGSTDEDSPMCRASNHFHDPTKPWDQSYLTDEPRWLDIACFNWKPFYSNVTWASGYLSSPPDGTKASFNMNPYFAPYNWDKARNNFYDSLTSETKVNRDIHYVWTLSTVGHIMHLLEDVSVPAHVRNDFKSHLTFNGISSLNPTKWYIQPFEHYIKNNPNLIISAGADYPIFSDKKITDFWDTDQFTGDNPTTSLSLGLAEFTHANYFSDLTIKNNGPDALHDFSYPYVNSADYQICPGLSPDGVDYQFYISRKSEGACPPPDQLQNVDHFAAISLLNDEFAVVNNDISTLKLWLDENVHQTYAEELLPRAVDYSAALLNYFFRGTLEITPPDQVVYSVTDGSDTPYNDNGNLHQQFTNIKAKVSNTTPGENIQNGIMRAVVKYKIVPNYMYDLSNYPPVVSTEDNVPNNMRDVAYSYSVSDEITLSQAEIDSLNISEAVEFSFNFTQPVPAGITNLSLQIIFKGTLGNETDIAIAVGMKDLMEPTHQVIWNSTDMMQLYGHLYTPDDNPYTPELDGIKNTPELAALVDLDSDGIFNEIDNPDGPNEPYIDPHGVTFGIGYISEPTSESTFYLSAQTLTQDPRLQPGRHIRLISLLDKPQDNFLVLEVVEDIFPDPSYFILASPGVINHEDNGVWQTPPTPVSTFRYGLDMDGITQIPLRQHYKVTYFLCHPVEGTDPDGNQVCNYPDSEAIPAELSPFPIDFVFFP